MRIASSIALALLVLSAFAAVAAALCGPAYVCSDVALSLIGSIEVDGVVIRWSSDSENASLGTYELYRFNCDQPECLHLVSTEVPGFTCDTEASYEVDDTPPTPYTQWTYQVRVKKADGSEQCRMNVVPQ